MKIEKINLWIWWGTLVFLSSMIFSIAAVQIMVGVLAVLWIVKIVITPGYNLRRTPFDLAFIAFVAARMLSILLSVNYSTSVVALYKEIPFYIIFFIFTNTLPIENKKNIRLLFWLLISVACLAALYGMTKVLLGIEQRANSTTSGYSTLGMFLAVAIAITLGLGKNKELVLSRTMWWMSLMVMGCGLLFTLNRTHWGVVAVIFIFVGLYRERVVLLISTVLTTFVIILVPVFTERFYQIIHFLDNTSGRNILWQGALMIITDRPIFGFGPRTFEEIFPLFNQLEDKLIASWHNDYLQVYMESGIVGLIAFLWIIFVIYYYGIQIIRLREFDHFYRDVAFAILLGMTAFFLTGLVGGFIIDPITSLLFRFLLAILALIASMCFRKQRAG